MGGRLGKKGKQTVKKADERGSCNQSSNKRHFPRGRRPALNRKRHYRSTPAASYHSHQANLCMPIFGCKIEKKKQKKKKNTGGRGYSYDLFHHQRLYRL